MSGGLGNRRWWLSFEDQHVALGRRLGEPLPVRVPFDADGRVSAEDLAYPRDSSAWRATCKTLAFATQGDSSRIEDEHLSQWIAP